MSKRKIQIYAAVFTLLFLGAVAPMAMTIKRDYDMDRLPIDTIVQGGHSFDIVHSSTCKCKH